MVEALFDKWRPRLALARRAIAGEALVAEPRAGIIECRGRRVCTIKAKPPLDEQVGFELHQRVMEVEITVPSFMLFEGLDGSKVLQAGDKLLLQLTAYGIAEVARV